MSGLTTDPNHHGATAHLVSHKDILAVPQIKDHRGKLEAWNEIITCAHIERENLKQLIGINGLSPGPTQTRAWIGFAVPERGQDVTTAMHIARRFQSLRRMQREFYSRLLSLSVMDVLLSWSIDKTTKCMYVQVEKGICSGLNSCNALHNPRMVTNEKRNPSCFLVLRGGRRAGRVLYTLFLSSSK
jgi:hypothetical protein